MSETRKAIALDDIEATRQYYWRCEIGYDAISAIERIEHAGYEVHSIVRVGIDWHVFGRKKVDR